MSTVYDVEDRIYGMIVLRRHVSAQDTNAAGEETSRRDMTWMIPFHLFYGYGGMY